MCGICISTKDKLKETLLNQVDRGLDSLWVINTDNYHKLVRPNYKGYKKFIKNGLNDTWWVQIMHHRKASIWKINANNAHPFKGEKFYLMQNGTARKFFNKYSLIYKKETDSECLLSYIENHANTIEDIAGELTKLSDNIWEDFGIVIVICIKTKQILFYSDWARETYIDIDVENNLVNGIFNYIPGKPNWYENIWHLIMDFNFNLISNNYPANWLNKEIFYPYFSWIQKEKETIASYNNWYVKTTTTPPFKQLPLKSYTNDDARYEYNLLWADEKLEYIDMLWFLQSDYYADSMDAIEDAFENYMFSYYWITQADAPDDYAKYAIRFESAFHLAYEQAIKNIFTT